MGSLIIFVGTSIYLFHFPSPPSPPKDGGRIENYFTYDFDLEGELSTLRRRQVRPYRDPRFDWQYGFVPLEEYLQLAKEEGKGVYVEIKHGDATNRVRRRFEKNSKCYRLTFMRNRTTLAHLHRIVWLGLASD